MGSNLMLFSVSTGVGGRQAVGIGKVENFGVDGSDLMNFPVVGVAM